MEITNFDRVRLTSVSSCFLDVEKIGKHSRTGSMAVAYTMGANSEYIKQKVEVRKKGNHVALITYHFSDAEIPEWWRDAEILFQWTEDEKG